jgi:hypothetical protein
MPPIQFWKPGAAAPGEPSRSHAGFHLLKVVGYTTDGSFQAAPSIGRQSPRGPSSPRRAAMCTSPSMRNDNDCQSTSTARSCSGVWRSTGSSSSSVRRAAESRRVSRSYIFQQYANVSDRLTCDAQKSRNTCTKQVGLHRIASLHAHSQEELPRLPLRPEWPRK